MTEYEHLYDGRERPIFNPFSASGFPKFNPNWIFRDNELKLYSKPKHMRNLIKTVGGNILKANELGKSSACLVIVYENEHINFASCFRIGPSIWCTAMHNLLPEDLTNSEVNELYLLLSEEIPGLGDHGSIRELKADSSYKDMIIECAAIPVDPKFFELYADDVDIKSGMNRDNRNDFALLRSEKDDGLEGFLLPADFNVMDQVGVLGYNLPVFESTLQRMFGDEAVLLSSITSLFNRYNKRSLSPGNVLEGVSNRIFPHSCSTVQGASGSAVVSLEHIGFFNGVHIGGWTKAQLVDNNYNVAISVNHPVFVVEYAKNVLPLISDDLKTLINTFLSKHADLIAKYNLNK
ncbi:hypothetical protein AKO1_002784 [Acrasis kona]|uniref:Uncharacterized protein n=1 Tax=Acrasis kona TaxID=1008807 RepID=A0AAW2YHV5_9EUKA